MRIPTGVITRNKTILPTLAGVSVKAALTTPILYYSLNGGTVTQKSSPTITHQGTNMAGQHKLLVDFGTTLTAGNDEEELAIKITSADCDDVHLTLEIYRPDTTEGNTLDVTATGEAGLDLDNTSGTLAAAQFASNFLTAAKIAASALNGKGDWNIGKTGYSVSALSANVITAASIAAAALNGKGDWNIGKTGYSVSTLAASTITAASIASNAFTAAKFAAASLNGKGDWNIGKTGYSLTQGFPSNFADMAITASTGLVSVGTLAANVITATSIASNAIAATKIAAAALNGKGDWNINKTGYALTQAFPANFAAQVITAGGAVDALVQGYLNTLLTETTAGRIAGNFDVFFENADALTTKVVDDVGGGALSAADKNSIADHVHRRQLANIRASADGDAVIFRSSIGAMSKLVNKVGIVGANLLTREEDDSTTFGTQAVTTDAAADPITDLDTT